MDPDRILEYLRINRLPSMRDIISLYKKLQEILLKEPNILMLTSPITVAGDLHGQYSDFRELLRIAPELPTGKLLFLGDYVDRGDSGVEVFTFLAALKVKYPQNVFLCRGNHECLQVSQVYGLYDEILRKFANIEVYVEMCKCFDCLPLSSLIDNRILTLHGGLSPQFKQLKDLQSINAKCDIPHGGIINDIVWGDPGDQLGFQASQRGAGYLFGQDICDKFCHENNLEFIIRSHQVVIEGYKWQFNNKLLTIWSCPNYCYRAGNVASICEIENQDLVFKIFDSVEEQKIEEGYRVIPDYFL